MGDWYGGICGGLRGLVPAWPDTPFPPQDTGLCADFHPGGQVVAVGLLTGR